jgi:hypothetical protein
MKTGRQKKEMRKGGLGRQGKDALVDQRGGTSSMMATTMWIRRLRHPLGLVAQQQVAEREVGAVVVGGEEEEEQQPLRPLLYRQQATRVMILQKHLLSHLRNVREGGEEGGEEEEERALLLLLLPRIRRKITAHQNQRPLRLRWTLMWIFRYIVFVDIHYYVCNVFLYK